MFKHVVQKIWKNTLSTTWEREFLSDANFVFRSVARMRELNTPHFRHLHRALHRLLHTYPRTKWNWTRAAVTFISLSSYTKRSLEFQFSRVRNDKNRTRKVNLLRSAPPAARVLETYHCSSKIEWNATPGVDTRSTSPLS